MMRWIRIVGYFCTALFLVSGAQASGRPVTAKTSFLDLQQEAADSASAGRTLMVMFEQEHCSYCEEMRRVNLADPEAADLIRRRFDLISIDILGDREVTTIAGAKMSEKEFAQQVRVQFTPMTLFLAADGKELFRMAGYYKPPMFNSALRYVADRRYTRESFRQYMEREAPGSASERLPNEPFFSATDDLAASVSKAAKRHKGLAIVFERSGCPACQELHAQTFSDPNFVRSLTDAFDVVRLDTRGARKLRQLDGTMAEESRIAERMNVGYTPTIVFLDSGGTEILRLDSYRKPAHLVQVIRYLGTGAYRSHASFQDWLRAQRRTAEAAPVNGKRESQ